ncbi:MAG: thioredoxin, partial [Anaerolineae bacterium]
LPYEWVPQLDAPRETPVDPVDVTGFRMPGAAAPGVREVTEVAGVKPYQRTDALCVVSTADLVKD